MSNAGFKQRAREELRNYALVAGYLWVCFGAILLYKTALLREEGVAFLPHGLAAIKALILGKFILLGEAAGVGTRLRASPPVAAVAASTVLYFLLLVVLSALEEIIVGKVHGHTLAAVLAEFRREDGLEMLAKCLLMLLVLVPLIAFKEYRRRIPGQPG